MAEKSKRYRNFASVFYPESAPDNWYDILTEQKVPVFISPLHDLDINPSGEGKGEKKKPHYHIILMFEGVKTPDQAKEVLDKIGCVGLEVINSLRGYARYLCHLDNPEKAQYKQEDVVALCGADYSSVIGLATDKYKAIGEIIDFCIAHDVVSYAQLLEYARLNRFEWFRVLCDNGTVVVKEYLKSRSWDNGVRRLQDRARKLPAEDKGNEQNDE